MFHFCSSYVILRQGLENFFCKGLDLVDPVVFVETTQLCCCNAKAATDTM